MDDEEKRKARNAASLAHYNRNKKRLLAERAAKRKANIEAVRAYKRAIYLANRDMINERIRAKRAANVEKTRADNRASYHRNIERRREDSRRYQREHKIEIKAYRVLKYQQSDKQKESVKKKVWRQANLEAAREQKREHYRQNKPAYIMHARLRTMNLERATPIWADLNKIAEIYAEAMRLSVETGVTHEVDHRIPLKGKMVCGLHVEGNLQILTKTANREKSNSFLQEE